MYLLEVAILCLSLYRAEFSNMEGLKVPILMLLIDLIALPTSLWTPNVSSRIACTTSSIFSMKALGNV